MSEPKSDKKIIEECNKEDRMAKRLKDVRDLKISRPPRAKVSAKEALKRMEEFSKNANSRSRSVGARSAEGDFTFSQRTPSSSETRRSGNSGMRLPDPGKLWSLRKTRSARRRNLIPASRSSRRMYASAARN